MSCINTSCFLDNTWLWRGNHLQKCPLHLLAEALLWPCPCPCPGVLSLAPCLLPPHSSQLRAILLTSLKSPWCKSSAPWSLPPSSMVLLSPWRSAFGARQVRMGRAPGVGVSRGNAPVLGAPTAASPAGGCVPRDVPGKPWGEATLSGDRGQGKESCCSLSCYCL